MATSRSTATVPALRHAQQRLRSGQDTHEVIAEDLGFRSTSAFYRAFKRWTGETPRSWLATDQDR